MLLRTGLYKSHLLLRKDPRHRQPTSPSDSPANTARPGGAFCPLRFTTRKPPKRAGKPKTFPTGLLAKESPGEAEGELRKGDPGGRVWERRDTGKGVLREGLGVGRAQEGGSWGRAWEGREAGEGLEPGSRENLEKRETPGMGESLGRGRPLAWWSGNPREWGEPGEGGC